MSEIVVVGSFKTHPGKEAEGLQAFEALVEPTHGEEGCVLYALHRGVDDPGRLAFVERWESRELLNAHLESDHVKAALAHADELFAENSIIVYEAVPRGEESKGSLAAHAGSQAL